MAHPARKRPADRKGSILVLTAIMMIAMMGMLAVAVDIGYLQMARTQLQQSADSAALAAAAELIDNEAIGGTRNMNDEIASARDYARQFAALNRVCTTSPDVNVNDNNDPSGDIVVGYLADPSDRTQQMNFDDPSRYNAVQVRVRRTASQNGEVPFYFARAFGLNSIATQCTATAALLNNIAGFRTPADGSNLGILPFALDKETWDDMLAGGGGDNWSFDDVHNQVVAGSDGVREVNLFPQGTGSPGNRGTVDIGPSNNSTSDIARQITSGVSPSDMAAIGGELRFNANGELFLNGDTGISAGVKDELSSIKGKPRIIPIFREVNGPGNNAQYTIVRFVGIRILEVKLTGSASSKRVIIQPANVTATGGIPGTGDQTSDFVYSQVWLVR
jgi:Flp pilus assembly protein TadG